MATPAQIETNLRRAAARAERAAMERARYYDAGLVRKAFEAQIALAGEARRLAAIAGTATGRDGYKAAARATRLIRAIGGKFPRLGFALMQF